MGLTPISAALRAGLKEPARVMAGLTASEFRSFLSLKSVAAKAGMIAVLAVHRLEITAGRTRFPISIRMASFIRAGKKREAFNLLVMAGEARDAVVFLVIKRDMHPRMLCHVHDNGSFTHLFYFVWSWLVSPNRGQTAAQKKQHTDADRFFHVDLLLMGKAFRNTLQPHGGWRGSSTPKKPK